MDSKTRELAFQLGHGYCRCSKDCTKPANQIHHMLPMFIDSIFNYCPINDCCHLNSVVPKISEHEASIYEKWLEFNIK